MQHRQGCQSKSESGKAQVYNWWHYMCSCQRQLNLGGLGACPLPGNFENFHVLKMPFEAVFRAF